MVLVITFLYHHVFCDSRINTKEQLGLDEQCVVSPYGDTTRLCTVCVFILFCMYNYILMYHAHYNVLCDSCTISTSRDNFSQVNNVTPWTQTAHPWTMHMFIAYCMYIFLCYVHYPVLCGSYTVSTPRDSWGWVSDVWNPPMETRCISVTVTSSPLDPGTLMRSVFHQFCVDPGRGCCGLRSCNTVLQYSKAIL